MMSWNVLLTGRAATSAAISRLPLIVRSASDIKTLRANSRELRRLPPEGLRVAIDGLDLAAARELQTRIRSYMKACGCAEGGAAALVAMLAVLTSIALQMSVRGPRWGDLGMAAAGLPLALVVGGMGKMLGLTVARFRFERCCSNVIRIIAKK